ncbi:MAG: XRE family transcriptional regulator [Chloroflexota bacterium]|nr:XRE family transcriptional regulator [Chloroflexota bacterium]
MPAQPPPKDLTEKLERLFRAIHPRGRGEYTYREVADGIRARGLAPISGTYVWQLRTGQRSNPTMKHIEGLAAFFGVPVNYFFNDDVATRVDTELDMIVALRETPIRHIALRASGLSPESLSAIAEMIEHVRKLEGLPVHAETVHEPDSENQKPELPGSSESN